jgi:hypothetical protein
LPPVPQHYKRLPVGQVVAGQTAALALKKVKRAQVGECLVGGESTPALSVASILGWLGLCQSDALMLSMHTMHTMVC